MKILAVGPLWRGSNAGGLFRALSRQGCIIEVTDEFYHISLRGKSTKTKVIEKFVRPYQIREFNQEITSKIKLFSPDILFVYKGAFVYPETLQYARQQKCKLVLFYPDVSMTNHGGYIPKCLPLYDLIFTTKTFGIKDLKNMYGVTNAHFIEHGFDPEIHRILPLSSKERIDFECDASFIGTYSPQKERYLATLKKQMPDIDLKIWGAQWDKSDDPVLKTSIKHTPVLGDLYAIAIQCSKINLGILSEVVVGSSSGDLITSRTFHIPGAGGFMLHERNKESVQYFDEGREAGFFDGPEELVKQVRYYLKDTALRNEIQQAGHERALRDHSLDARAQTVISHIKSLL